MSSPSENQGQAYYHPQHGRPLMVLKPFYLLPETLKSQPAITNGSPEDDK